MYHKTLKGETMTKQNVTILTVQDANGKRPDEHYLKSLEDISYKGETFVKAGRLGARIYFSENAKQLGITPENLKLQFENSWADHNSAIYVDSSNTISLDNTLLIDSSINDVNLKHTKLRNTRLQYLPNPEPKSLQNAPTFENLYMDDSTITISNTPDLNPNQVVLKNIETSGTSIHIHDQSENAQIDIQHLNAYDSYLDLATNKVNIEYSTMNDSNFTVGQTDTFHMVDTDMKNISCRSDSTKDTTNHVHLSDAVLGNLQLHNTVNMEHSKVIASKKFPSIIDNVDLKNISIKAPDTKVDIINTKLIEESPYELNTNKQFSTHVEQTPYQPIIIKDGVMFTSSPTITQETEVENHTVPTNEEIVELDM
jgi:hypothetical protein